MFMKILIADNSKPARRRLISLVNELDNVKKIDETENVIDATAKIICNRYETVIIDISIPGNGFRLINIIKTLSPEIKIIIYSMYDSKQFRERSIELGATYFFSKNSDFYKILKVIKELSENG